MASILALCFVRLAQGRNWAQFKPIVERPSRYSVDLALALAVSDGLETGTAKGSFHNATCENAVAADSIAD